MEEEKMFVLKMLEKGKITAEEAYKLLEALEGSDNSYSEKKQRIDFQERLKEKMKKLDAFSEKMGILSDIPKEVEKGLEEIDERIDKIHKKDWGTSIVEKILNFFEEDEGQKFEKELEFKDVKENTSVDVEISNGKVRVEGWDRDYIYVNIKYTAKNKVEEGMHVNYDEGFLKIENDKRVKTSKIEIYLPIMRYKEVKLEVVNGKIVVGDIQSENMILETVNGDITVKNMSFEKGRLSTVNGGVFVEDLKVNSPNSLLKVETTNGSVRINLGEENVEVSYELKTAAGKCNVDLPDALHEAKKWNYLKGSTRNYGKSEKNLKVYVDVVNGSITLE